MKSYLALLLLAASSLFGQTRTTVSVEGNQTISGNKSFTGSNTFNILNIKNLEGCNQVDGLSGFAQTDAGIQAAVTATADGGCVFLANGTYLMTGTGACQVTINRRVNIVGGGWATILQWGASVPNTTDMFCLKPSTASTVDGGMLAEFQVAPISGTPGRHAVVFDGTNGAFADYKIEHIQVLPSFATTAIAVINASISGTGTPFTTMITNNYLAGGLDCTNCGDNVSVVHNIMTGSGAVIVNLVPIGHSGIDGGAHSFLFKNNNVTLCGMIQVVNAWAGNFEGNNLEQACPSTEPNSCVLDIIGNVSPGPIQGLTIQGNYIGTNGAFVNNGICVDQAKGTDIHSNYIVQNVTAVKITANANNTHLGYNIIAPANPISAWLSDSGTGTIIDYVEPTKQARFLVGNTGWATNSSATPYLFAASNQLRGSSNTQFCFVNSTTDATGGCILGISMSGTTLVAIGDGSAPAVSNRGVLQTGGIDLGTSQIRGALAIASAARILFSATAPTIATHFNTSGDSLVSNGTASFTVTVGTGAGTSTGVLTLPTAATGWNCWLTNQTRADQIQQTASSTTSATFTNFGTTFAATNWTNSDVLRGGCSAN